jgi:hypothetical protein
MLNSMENNHTKKRPIIYLHNVISKENDDWIKKTSFRN